MRILRTHIENALESLSANRMRTFLTMVGVAIGIASMTIIFGLSGGVSKLIAGQVAGEGGTILVVRPREIGVNNKNIISQLATSRTFSKSSLSSRDLEEISKVEKVSFSSPLATFVSDAKTEDQSVQTTILSTTPDLEKIISLKVKEGQFIAEPSNTKNVVVGHQLAIDLFGTTQVVGRNITIRGQKLFIIGVLEKQDSEINFNNVNFNNSIIMHYELGEKISQSGLQIQQINVRAESINNLNLVGQQINSRLLELHNNEQDFEVLSGEKVSHPSGQFFELAALVLAMVASVSLIVGGIGIMNIMLVNVSERTREIGIRKALGANNRHIMFQFLTESIIISFIGGLLGFVAGISFSFGMSALLPFSPSISWRVFSLIIVISVGVGVVFGIYPAIRASRKHPIESLRHYN